jgi:hypothetical protein
MQNLQSLQKTITRRTALQLTGCGFGALAAQAMAGDAAAADELIAHVAPRAKRIIFLFMQGGVSHVDSFDYKPTLAKIDGNKQGFDDARQLAKTGKRDTQHRVMKSPWQFQQYGDSGRWVSELFPETAQHVDKLCFLHGMHTEGVAHGPSTLFLHCGSKLRIRIYPVSFRSHLLSAMADRVTTAAHFYLPSFKERASAERAKRNSRSKAFNAAI